LLLWTMTLHFSRFVEFANGTTTYGQRFSFRDLPLKAEGGSFVWYQVP